MKSKIFHAVAACFLVQATTFRQWCWDSQEPRHVGGHPDDGHRLGGEANNFLLTDKKSEESRYEGWIWKEYLRDRWLKAVWRVRGVSQNLLNSYWTWWSQCRAYGSMIFMVSNRWWLIIRCLRSSYHSTATKILTAPTSPEKSRNVHPTTHQSQRHMITKVTWRSLDKHHT